MKKATLTAVAALITILSFTSCEKSYVCSCNDTAVGTKVDHNAGFPIAVTRRQNNGVKHTKQILPLTCRLKRRTITNRLFYHNTV